MGPRAEIIAYPPGFRERLAQTGLFYYRKHLKFSPLGFTFNIYRRAVYNPETNKRTAAQYCQTVLTPDMDEEEGNAILVIEVLH